MDAAPVAFGPLPPLSVGEFAPWFKGHGPDGASYAFASLAGRYMLLAFLPDAPAERAAALAALEPHRHRFDDRRLSGFLVVRDGDANSRPGNAAYGPKWLIDPDGAISRLYGATDDAGREQPHWLLLDPSMRVLARFPVGSPAVFDEIARLPMPSDYAGVPMTAPVLIAPRIFEPDLCKRLIGFFEAAGGEPSGVIRAVEGRSVTVVDDFKKRRDAYVRDPALRRELMGRIERRLLPEIEKAFQFRVTRLERYAVCRYDSAEGGYFRAHRDNQTDTTAYRRFALSINLNAEEFEGGDLRFPEFGERTYRAPTGGAAVFSCSLLHEVTPVNRGRRYAFLPFLYDEDGVALRAAIEARMAAQDAA